MRRRHDRSSIEELRLTIDCLPRATRIAMLQGVAENEIIVGAYSDREGGVCPMLAAHRCGGRTSFISFARAWDRFTRVRHARRRQDRKPKTNGRTLICHFLHIVLATCCFHYKTQVYTAKDILSRIKR